MRINFLTGSSHDIPFCDGFATACDGEFFNKNKGLTPDFNYTIINCELLKGITHEMPTL